ncbi:MAG: carbon monoxide dehydrogenase subunit G [Gammaproteobacteria bacterium]|nr:carbon monoxide dehydrogenase subunit G [Gammaproteobacteria bacterium]
MAERQGSKGGGAGGSAGRHAPAALMDISGEFQIPASREHVWQALNDPDVLKQCIPGCESIERESDTELTARMKAKIGPVKATFSSRIVLSDLNPPESYTISGKGKGGPAGFGKGSAQVRLEETGAEETTLRYTASLQVGGKLAQVGSRLVGGAARKIADDFFSRFADVVSDGAGER